MKDLLTKEQRAELERVAPLYSQDGKGLDAVVHHKFFLGSFVWYVTEGNAEGDAFTLFGLTVNDPGRAEMGYISFDELNAVVLPWERVGLEFPAEIVESLPRTDKDGLRVERDLHFTPKTFREVAKTDKSVKEYFLNLGYE